MLFVLGTTQLFSQSMTQANEPAIGESSTMYLCDSNVVNYAGLTGTGITWDYSQLAGYAGQTKLVEVLDASTTPDYASFPGSVKAYGVGNTIITYFSSTATERTSQGFKFIEPSLGDVLATFENDAMTQVSYPFAYGNSLTDVYDGTIDFTFNSLPVNENLSGDVFAIADGFGTLKFPMGVDVANVLRYRSVDTSLTTLPIFGNIELIREQYEYYDYSSQNLPIFIHSTITMQQPATATPIQQVSLVLSLYPTSEFVGLNEKTSSTLSLIPNPATNAFTVIGSQELVQVELLDAQGRLVLSTSAAPGTKIIIESLESGTYFVKLNTSSSSSIKQLMKQ